MSRFQLDYRSENLSWHYHLFASWSLTDRGKSPGKVLEIGTESGDFASFLAEILPMKDVHTIDLPDSSQKFVSEYGRQDDDFRSGYLSRRSDNLAAPNIHFKSIDSSFLLSAYSGPGFNTGQTDVVHGVFDAIWVDGDHQNPQVTIDIVQSLALLRSDGFLLVDDVVIDSKFKGDKYVSNDSWKTLEHLQASGLVRSQYLNKRVRAGGFKKHLAYVQKIT